MRRTAVCQDGIDLSRLLLILAALICSSESSSYCTVLTFFMTSAPQQEHLIAECLCMPTHSLHSPALSGRLCLAPSLLP